MCLLFSGFYFTSKKLTDDTVAKYWRIKFQAFILNTPEFRKFKASNGFIPFEKNWWLIDKIRKQKNRLITSKQLSRLFRHLFQI